MPAAALAAPHRPQASPAMTGPAMEAPTPVRTPAPAATAHGPRNCQASLPALAQAAPTPFARSQPARSLFRPQDQALHSCLAACLTAGRAASATPRTAPLMRSLSEG